MSLTYLGEATVVVVVVVAAATGAACPKGVARGGVVLVPCWPMATLVTFDPKAPPPPPMDPKAPPPKPA